MGPEINTEILYKAQIMRARVVEIPAHLDWTDQEERMESRQVSLRVSTTSKLLDVLQLPVPAHLLLPLPRPPAARGRGVDARRRGRGRSSSGSSELSGGSFDYRLTQAFQDAYQARPHSFIVGGFALVIAVQLISLGLLATQTKRYFEETFHLGTSLTRRLERMERAGWAVDLPEVVPARLPEPAPVETAPAVAAATAASSNRWSRPRRSGRPWGRPVARLSRRAPPVVPVAPRVGLARWSAAMPV